MDEYINRLRLSVRLAAAVLSVTGCLVLVGWTLGNPILTSFIPGLVAMNPATAVLFVMTSISLGLHAVSPNERWRRLDILRGSLGGLVLIAGLLTLLGFLFGWQIRLDRVLFADALGENRMAPNTAACFVLVGLAILSLETRSRGRRLSQALALIVLGAALMSLLGYGYGAKNLYGIGNYIPMALNSALLFAVAAVGLLCVDGDKGLPAVLRGPHSGSAMARRLLPTALIVPCILGFLRVLGQRAGLYETEFGAALMVLTTVILLVAAISLTASALNRTDTERLAATEALRRSSEEISQLNESLERRVQERTAELAEVNRDLAQKNQENEMFVYSVSHDLRSPLVNLQGFSKELDAAAAELKTLIATGSAPEDLRTKAVSLVDNDVRQSIRFIQTAVSRLGNIIDALLRLSRVGRVEYQCGPVDLKTLVNRVVESMSAGLYDAGVCVRVHELPPGYGDATALEQLFANLIGNAVKYRDQSRASVIEVGVADRDGASPVDEMRTYYVKDNGLGIPAAHQDKIFQAFKRAHPNVASGEGMGLAIVRRTADRHGGRVWVESQEGQGSTFFISLPTAAPPRSAGPRTFDSQKGESEHGSGITGHLVGGRR